MLSYNSDWLHGESMVAEFQQLRLSGNNCFLLWSGCIPKSCILEMSIVEYHKLLYISNIKMNVFSLISLFPPFTSNDYVPQLQHLGSVAQGSRTSDSLNACFGPLLTPPQRLLRINSPSAVELFLRGVDTIDNRLNASVICR